MIQHLSGAHILVADDQNDVARTLCRPLQKAGARLHFAADGRTALEEISSRPLDLILIDMKMPPNEWGGLWLLKQLQEGGWRLPSLVLSGEGSKKQVVEALRLGAIDWIDKDDAGEELLERCVKVLADRLAQALAVAAGDLPTPLAYRIARYERTADLEKKTAEGLHALESIFRFAALLGLSTTSPAPLAGITPVRLASPSMGTWFDICAAIAKLSGAGSDFTRMMSWLVPGRSEHQSVQEFISVRNNLAHGRGTPTAEQSAELDFLLRRFAHRAASSWRADMVVPTSMTYDGNVYSVDVLSLRGTGKPIPTSIRVQKAVITGQVFLIPHGSEPLPLAPWILAHTGSGSDSVRCLHFDGVQRGKSSATSAAPFRFSTSDEELDAPSVSHPQATAHALAEWATP
ncbi:response regulator [Streptomyces sp. NPDC006430]|uniref:response regulator transcription factor n=1 Tax=Streptomyces sp. NPDC006430 TaxID=3154299 RepID=UPI0033A8CEBB